MGGGGLFWLLLLKKVKKRKNKKKKKKKKDPCEVNSEFPELITLNVIKNIKNIFYTKTNVFLRKYEIVGKIK